MDQNLNLYRIFFSVANKGNISHAANELFISQPAISKAISRLEENLNVKLFHRNSRGVVLTPEGKMFYEYVQNAFSALETGEERIRQVTQLGMGHLRIGVSTTLCKYVLLPYLKNYIKQFPHIKITIMCQPTNQTLQLLEQDKIDIGLIGRPKPATAMHFHPLGEISDTFVSTKSYINQFQPAVLQSPHELFQQATILFLDKENMSRQYVDNYLVKNQLLTNHILEISTMDLLIEFAKIGLGIACVIKEFISPELEDNSLSEINLPFPIPKRTIGFTYMKSRHLSPAVKEFIDFSKLGTI